eukprot:759633-Hanusia_phi.AAC.1
MARAGRTPKVIGGYTLDEGRGSPHRGSIIEGGGGGGCKARFAFLFGKVRREEKVRLRASLVEPGRT